MNGILLATAAAAMVTSPFPASSPPIPPYSFHQTTLIEAFDPARRPLRQETKEEEVFPVGNRLLFHRLLSHNNKPLSPNESQTEAQRLETFRKCVLDGRKPKIPEQVTDLTSRFSEQDLDQAFISEPIGTETVGGRPCTVYKFRGRPGRVLKVGGQYQKFFDVVVDGITGRLWIDQEDRKPARGEVRLKQPVNLMFGLLVSIRQFSLDVEFQRLEPGVWWPRYADGFVDARYLVFQTFIRHGQVQNDGFARISPSASP